MDGTAERVGGIGQWDGRAVELDLAGTISTGSWRDPPGPMTRSGLHCHALKTRVTRHRICTSSGSLLIRVTRVW